MLRRVFAWVTLIGFIFLMVNLFFLQTHQTESLIAYIAIVILFLFTSKKPKSGE